jgi:hypothetical protein
LNTQSLSNVYFFESQKDIGVSKPYATLNADELTSMIQRFVAWAAILATHPETAESFGDSSTAHIRLATDLRNAIRSSHKESKYPNVVLQEQKSFAAMELMRRSTVLQPGLDEMMRNNNLKWAADHIA